MRCLACRRRLGFACRLDRGRQTVDRFALISLHDNNGADTLVELAQLLNDSSQRSRRAVRVTHEMAQNFYRVHEVPTLIWPTIHLHTVLYTVITEKATRCPRSRDCRHNNGIKGAIYEASSRYAADCRSDGAAFGGKTATSEGPFRAAGWKSTVPKDRGKPKRGRYT